MVLHEDELQVGECAQIVQGKGQVFEQDRVIPLHSRLLRGGGHAEPFKIGR